MAIPFVNNSSSYNKFVSGDSLNIVNSVIPLLAIMSLNEEAISSRCISFEVIKIENISFLGVFVFNSNVKHKAIGTRIIATI